MTTTTAHPLSRDHRRAGWLQGAAVGLAAAIAGTVALIVAGAIRGRGLAILVAHLVANLFLLIGILWVHPSLKLDFLIPGRT
jgi:hypothetical protein